MRKTGCILTAILILILSAPVSGADETYKKFDRSKSDQPLLELIVDLENWTVVFYKDSQEEYRHDFPTSSVQRQSDGLDLGGTVRMNDDGIEIPGHIITPQEIGEIVVDAGDGTGYTVLKFMAVDPTKKSKRYRRQRDVVSYWNSIEVTVDDFVRGSVIALSGDVAIRGEVNGDVVAIFGDIKVDGDAVIRGDVISVHGEVKLDPESSVYGMVSSQKGDISTRRHRARRWKKFENAADFTGNFVYNRVDGALLTAGFVYEHRDSIIPSFGASGGYAYASERWRYNFFLTQTLIRGQVPVQIGGEVFRQLKSDDDRIIGEGENTVYALLFNEDWRDYYEAEGAYGFARVGFLKWNTLEVGYLSESQNWLDAHPRLWSLFGGKEFRGNYSSVPYPIKRAARATDFDEAQVTSLKLKLTVDSRDDEKQPRNGWNGFAAYEYSPDDWKGDFDFERFEIKIKRFQPLSRYLTLHALAAYGRVKGDNIPLTRDFFLGGLGTLHGYRHKEYMGHEYILFSGEYRFRVPHSDVVPFVQFDGGKIAPDRLHSGTEWLSSLSLGAAFAENIKLFVSKRLDRDDEDIRFYARFSANPF